MTGEGVLNDHDGNRGTWRLSGMLAGGAFTGTIDMILGNKPMSVTMKGAYAENGFCVFRGENGRNRFELRGRCSPQSFGPGVAKGYFDGDRDFTGEFSGALRWGKPIAPAAKVGVVPSAKLMCVQRERVGGNVAGDPARYELKPSSMVSLVLAGGAYRTLNSAGRYTVEGARIRFAGGTFAGAVGELRPDASGAPAVYFKVEDNRGPNGVPIVDVWPTACVQQSTR